MQILVPQKYTAHQVRNAELKRDEFKPAKRTSASANLDNMTSLGKAVLLCSGHVSKFSAKHARYRAHPDKKLRRVHGRCDDCQQVDLCFLFLNERDARAEQEKLEKFKRTVEYGHLST